MRAYLAVAGFLLAGLFGGNAHAFPWYAGGDNIRGAQFMTPDERKDYVSSLLNMPNFDACRTYMQAHYLEVDRRAKEKGVKLEPVKGDPCEVMQKMGRFNK